MNGSSTKPPPQQFCAVLGILPPSKDLLESIKANVTTMPNNKKDDANDEASSPGSSSFVTWRDPYSLVHDDERQDALTLLASVMFTEPITHEDIVAAVQQFITSTSPRYEDGEKKNGDESSLCLCELWACAPALIPMRPVGGYESIRISPPPDNNDEEILEKRLVGREVADTMLQHGLVIQPAILKQPHLLQELRQIVDEAIANVEALLAEHRPELTIGEDSFACAEIASRNLERFDMRLDTNAKAVEFVKTHIYSQPFVRQFLATLLGDLTEVNFDLSVVYSRPGAISQKWHSDGKHFGQDAGWTEEGWKTPLEAPYAICLFIPLIDLNQETGYTQFWPGSHRSPDLMNFGPAAELIQATYDGIGQAGDGIWYDYRLLHRGIYNISKHVRPVLQVIFKKKWYVERVNYGKESIIRS